MTARPALPLSGGAAGSGLPRRTAMWGYCNATASRRLRFAPLRVHARVRRSVERCTRAPPEIAMPRIAAAAAVLATLAAAAPAGPPPCIGETTLTGRAACLGARADALLLAMETALARLAAGPAAGRRHSPTGSTAPSPAGARRWSAAAPPSPRRIAPARVSPAPAAASARPSGGAGASGRRWDRCARPRAGSTRRSRSACRRAHRAAPPARGGAIRADGPARCHLDPRSGEA